MNTMSRRALLSGSGAAVAMPTLAFFMSGEGRAQAPTNTTDNAEAAYVPANEDLARYYAQAIAKNIHLHASGNLDQQGTRTLSQQIILFANHLDECGFDAAFKKYCADPNTVAAIPSHGVPINADLVITAQQKMTQLNPSLGPDTFPVRPGQMVSADSVVAVHKLIAEYGCSHILRTHADSLRGRTLASPQKVSFTPEQPRRGLLYPVYAKDKSVHMLDIGSCNTLVSRYIDGWNSMSDKDKCNMIEAALAALGGASSAAACAIALAATPVVAAICVLGWAVFYTLALLVSTIGCASLGS